MTFRPSLHLLIPLTAGLALGCAGAWFFQTISHTTAGALATHSKTSDATSPAPILLLPARLADADATAALAAYLALPALPSDAPAADIHERFTRLRALLTLLPPSHFSPLFDALARRTGDPEARCRRIAFSVWTEQDAPAAARWALSLLPGEAINARARTSYLHVAAKAWAETDFDAAYAWVNTLGDPQLARGLAGLLLTDLITTDPTRALTLARALGDDFFSANRDTLFSAWSATDPAAAVRALGADLLTQKSRPYAVHQALAQWISRDPAAAFAWIQAQPDESTNYTQSLLYAVTTAAPRAPASARALADLLTSRPDLPDRFSLLRGLAINWAQNDPAAVLDWLQSQPASEDRDRLVESSLGIVGSANFLTTLHLLPEGPARDKHLSDYLADFAKSNPAAALAWIATHDSPEVAAASVHVESAILAHLALTDPAAALSRWRSLPDSPERQAAVGPIALAWAATDPAASLRFLTDELARHPSTSTGRDSLFNTAQSVASRLARKDPAAVMKWAATLNLANLQNSAYYALANDHDHEAFNQISTPVSHAIRADLLATIPDARVREAPLTFLLSNWLQRDYDSARAWLDSNDALAPGVAAKLLEANAPDNVANF